jgi:phospholipase/carboxylesterase
MTLQAILVPAKREPAKGLLVGLHGWGASGQDVAAVAAYLNLPNYQFAFPDAPFPFPYGGAGRVWYNFPANYSFASSSDFAKNAELQASRQQLTDWLRSLESQTGVPLSRTVLAGFSQGGAMTLDIGLQLPLAAIMILSGYLHAPIDLPQPIDAAKLPQVVIMHGRSDQVVPLRAAHQARDRLTELGIPVAYEELTMGHEISMSVLSRMQSFIEDKLE